eukprot:CAMPEP_0185571904 /NCGR_PEP_ID=MMETSP0434-20130131/3898_1 /TAXON_ID=626734 ORGANISM="Favella taraikaensis, Strain Fe Narragansett Bay" /NCGR_SAMPLE_ID=MMETSP0434 /ASSEMBLY_ACC=CAM_ASM_000379 /LENGTH=66 /DNA_ID=CAMNT_0028187537 /DNA_START=1691 /DNA_END=1891 /DNA_ORIENTATION=+
MKSIMFLFALSTLSGSGKGKGTTSFFTGTYSTTCSLLIGSDLSVGTMAGFFSNRTCYTGILLSGCD